MKYKVTNTSQLSEAGKRNVFLTEAGKLIKPGEHCVCNRLDNGTRRLGEAKVLKIEEGSFQLPSVFDKKTPPVKPPTPPTASQSADSKRAAADARAMDDRMSATSAPKPVPGKTQAHAEAKAAAAKAAAAKAAEAEELEAAKQADEDAKASTESDRDFQPLLDPPPADKVSDPPPADDPPPETEAAPLSKRQQKAAAKKAAKAAAKAAGKD